MKTLKQRIQFMHEGGMVRRFHQHCVHVPDTDARHSHGVAMLVYFLSAGIPSAELLMSALTHDLAEQSWGDIPAPTKIYHGINLSKQELTTLTEYGLSFDTLLGPADTRLLKLADMLDAMLYCCSERALGNVTLRIPYRRLIGWVNERYTDRSPKEHEVILAIEKIWSESNDPEGPQFDCYAE